MLLLPEHFDKNEIFLTIVGLLMVALLTLLPKKFTYGESTLFLLFNFWLAVVVDHILAGPPLDLYNIMDQAKFEVMDVFNYLFLYSTTGYLYLYLFSRFDRSSFCKVLFVIAAVIITILLEWISLQLKVFTYKNWNLLYSSVAYFFIYFFNILFYRFVKSRARPRLG
jgi:hypothetical protein